MTAEKPYTANARWGFSLTYTLGFAEQIGGDLFSLDFPTPEDYPRYPTANDERYRIVATAVVGLPWDLLGSTFITLGDGLPYNIDDQSQGGGPNERQFLRNGGRQEGTFPYQSVDLRLEKAFRFGARAAGVASIAEAFNIFDHANYKNFDGFIPTPPATNPNFGQPRETHRSRPAAAVRPALWVLSRCAFARTVDPSSRERARGREALLASATSAWRCAGCAAAPALAAPPQPPRRAGGLRTRALLRRRTTRCSRTSRAGRSASSGSTPTRRPASCATARAPTGRPPPATRATSAASPRSASA